MESSRIYVKGIPPSLSADEFKRHFSRQSAITDARLIPHRRIGYVGYKTPEDAARAVKYHNKSFIRMSKIGVELARSVEEQHALGTAINSANSSKRGHAEIQDQLPTDLHSHGEKKRKRDGPAVAGGVPKLQEFLEVMQPPSKSRIWENQDAPTAQTSAQANLKVENTVVREAQSDEVYENVPKKRRKERKSENKDVAPAETSVSLQAPSTEAATIPTDLDLSQEAPQEPFDISLVASDADWLRSRTSRLLGLVDDNDLQTTAPPGEAPTDNAGLSEVPELVKEGSMSETSVQMDKEVQIEEDVFENQARGNGRLFVRNLTYTITEEELRKHFEDEGHGAIGEVSQEL